MCQNKRHSVVYCIFPLLNAAHYRICTMDQYNVIMPSFTHRTCTNIALPKPPGRVSLERRVSFKHRQTYIEVNTMREKILARPNAKSFSGPHSQSPCPCPKCKSIDVGCTRVLTLGAAYHRIAHINRMGTRDK